MIAMLVGLPLVAMQTAEAESVSVGDNEPGREAYFLAIRSARFKNAERVVTVLVSHPTLEKRYVDRVQLSMLVGRSSSRPSYRVGYDVRWKAGRRARLLRQVPGQEYPDRVRCEGLGFRLSEADHKARIKVPSRCLNGGRQVKMGYLIRNDGGNVSDTAPGRGQQDLFVSNYTRWLRRG